MRVEKVSCHATTDTRETSPSRNQPAKKDATRSVIFRQRSEIPEARASRRPLAGRDGAMEDLTVLAPQTFRVGVRDWRSLRAGPRPFEPDREKREHPAILDDFL
jgi:hypothetical protein